MGFWWWWPAKELKGVGQTVLTKRAIGRRMFGVLEIVLVCHRVRRACCVGGTQLLSFLVVYTVKCGAGLSATGSPCVRPCSYLIIKTRHRRSAERWNSCPRM